MSKSTDQGKILFFWARKLFLVSIGLLLAFHLVHGQQTASTEQTYRLPPEPIANLVDAPPTPSISIDPTKEWLLVMERPNLTSIKELAQPELRIAGIRINPKTNGPSRRSYYTGLKLLNIKSGKKHPINGLPDNVKIRNIEWSPNGLYIAFSVVQENQQNLWIADTKNKQAKMLMDKPLNSAYHTPFNWLPDSKTLVCKVVPEDRGKEPKKPSVPKGPIIRETTGEKAPARTYQDLLQNPYDEKLFDYYLNTQVVLVAIDGDRKKIGSTGLIKRIQPSPSGEYILVETIHRPYSYLVPVYRFPYRVEVWDRNGNVVQQIADLPLAENVPIGFGAVPTGPRSFDWRSDAPATLYWVEAQDGGNPHKEADIRDTIYMLKAPFSEKPEKLVSLKLRYRGVYWGNENLALVNEWWWQTRKIRVWSIKPDASSIDRTLLFDYSWQDRYNDPGSPQMTRTSTGYSVLLTSEDNEKIYLVGDGASPEGDRPFLDEFDLDTQETKRLWRSQAPYYERPIRLLDTQEKKILTRRESKDEPPNYFVRDLKEDQLTQLTDFPHPTPQLTDVQKKLIRYEREDGVQLTATLYLPPDYQKEDGPLPMLMWAYPTEYKSADAASQVKDSPYRFVRVGWWSPLLFLVHGYAVLDDPSMPIIGEGEKEPNDTYVQQLVSSAKAAVDEVVKRGVAEEGKIAIGGHSYGAFMAANLLAHSDLFAAGIARSGAYNRTLTPFGFQAEERTFWEAPEVYFRMSPFMHADDVDEPILLIHGEEDNNSGTFPIQSKRFYHALKGHGAKARLVMLPHESHGYRARESIMHMLWEMTQWLDQYVANKIE